MMPPRYGPISKGSLRWLTFQSNGKLIVFDSKEDPLNQHAAWTKGLKPEYLASLLENGAIEQANRNENCFQELVIDFGLLLQSSIKIFDPETQEEKFMPAVKLTKSQYDAKSMEIQVYRVNLSKAKEQIENTGRVLPGALSPSFLDPSHAKCEIDPEAQTHVQLTFEDEATLQRAFG